MTTQHTNHRCDVEPIYSKVEPAHPQDLLVVGWLKEREDYPQFHENQVVSVAVTIFTEWLRGRKFRRAYVTNRALEHRNAEPMLEQLAAIGIRYGWRPIAYASDYAEVSAADDRDDLALAARLAGQPADSHITPELIDALKHGE